MKSRAISDLPIIIITINITIIITKLLCVFVQSKQYANGTPIAYGSAVRKPIYSAVYYIILDICSDKILL